MKKEILIKLQDLFSYADNSKEVELMDACGTKKTRPNNPEIADL